MTPTVRQRLAAAFTEALPREACGLLIGQQKGEERYAVDIALPAGACGAIGSFELPDREISRMSCYAAGRDLEIVAVFHSHPGGDDVLSDTDVAALRHSEWPWLVVTMDSAARLKLAAYAPGTAQRIAVRWS